MRTVWRFVTAMTLPPTHCSRLFFMGWSGAPDPMSFLIQSELARIEQDQRELARISQNCFRYDAPRVSG